MFLIKKKNELDIMYTGPLASASAIHSTFMHITEDFFVISVNFFSTTNSFFLYFSFISHLFILISTQQY